MEPTLGVVVALKSEASALLGRRWRYRPEQDNKFLSPTDDLHTIIACSGVGPLKALTAAHKLIAGGIHSLASVGLAGGLDPKLDPGHIIIATNLLSLQNEKTEGPWNADPRGVTLAKKILAPGKASTQCGTVLTTSQAILARHRKESLFRETRALTVDMESAEVARAASEAHIPFFCLRVVCDPAQRSVPEELSMSIDSFGNIQTISMLRHLMRKPSLIIDLLYLARYFQSARSVLERTWRSLMINNLPQQLDSGI
jgi:adenosylhomocysteine nucleosidase